MKPKAIYVLFSVFTLISCSSFLKVPPIPSEPMAASEEIKYIHETDQKDRRQNLLRFFLLSEEKLLKNEKVLAVSDRDSFRLARIITLHDSIKTDADKFYGAYTYFHGGGLKMKQDTFYFRIAYELFKDLSETAVDKKWKKEGTYYTPRAHQRWQNALKNR